MHRAMAPALNRVSSNVRLPPVSRGLSRRSVSYTHLLGTSFLFSRHKSRVRSFRLGLSMPTVMQNVRYLQDRGLVEELSLIHIYATHEEVVAAAKKACCHDFILTLPQGYDTVIGEGGSSLSRCV